jgi:hypothetical protein
MFQLHWREHKTHEWVLEGRFPAVRAAILYLATDAPVLVGQYKLSYEGIQIMLLDMNVFEPLEALRTKLS